MSSNRREFLQTVAGAAAFGTLLSACGSDETTAKGIASTGGDSGWYMPAEEAEHERTWMCWPSSRQVWGRDLRGVQDDIVRIAQAISDFEPVTMLVRKEAKADAAKRLGSDITLRIASVDDLWARDTLPLFLINGKAGQLAAGRVRFNGWGNKQIHSGDTKLGSAVAKMLKIKEVKSGVTGEGGGLEVDGEGTILAARSSWVNKNRNPNLSEKQISSRLAKTLGAERVLWVDGLKGQDITDGHIDTLARFVDLETILVETPAVNDIWMKVARKTRKQVEGFETLEGKPYEFVTLKQPSKLPINSDSFLSSYVNYHVCNGAVIAPKFGDKRADDAALATMKDAYPGREIVQIRIDEVANGGGGIHCATQQQPKV